MYEARGVGGRAIDSAAARIPRCDGGPDSCGAGSRGSGSSGGGPRRDDGGADTIIGFGGPAVGFCELGVVLGRASGDVLGEGVTVGVDDRRGSPAGMLGLVGFRPRGGSGGGTRFIGGSIDERIATRETVRTSGGNRVKRGSVGEEMMQRACVRLTL